DRWSSRIRKIALDTDSAQTRKVASTVTFRGAKRPKLAKIIVSQKISTTRKGAGTALPGHAAQGGGWEIGHDGNATRASRTDRREHERVGLAGARRPQCRLDFAIKTRDDGRFEIVWKSAATPDECCPKQCLYSAKFRRDNGRGMFASAGAPNLQ